MKDNGVSYKLSMQDYEALTQEVARIQQILARAEIVPSPKAAVVDVPLPTDGRRPLSGADKMPEFAVRSPSDITRAELDRVVGVPLNRNFITAFYSFQWLDDVKFGWAPEYHNAYQAFRGDVRSLKPGEQNEDMPKMKRVLESFPAFRGFKVLMLVSMSVKKEDFPGAYKWTRRAPESAPGSCYECVNLVVMGRDGKLVCDPNAWFGVYWPYEAHPYADEDILRVQEFPRLIANGVESATNAFVTGFIPRLARAIQFSR